jgi:hypothetical protein
MESEIRRDGGVGNLGGSSWRSGSILISSSQIAQRLVKQGLPMVESPQSVPNLTWASSNLYELIKGWNLIAYPAADMRLAVSRPVAVETTRDWRIARKMPHMRLTSSSRLRKQRWVQRLHRQVTAESSRPWIHLNGESDRRQKGDDNSCHAVGVHTGIQVGTSQRGCCVDRSSLVA